MMDIANDMMDTLSQGVERVMGAALGACGIDSRVLMMGGR